VASVNGDLSVSAIDLGLVAAAFGMYAYGALPHYYDFDVTRDGSINALDLGLVAVAFGPCP
jgi:hypothetical protein